MSRLQRLNTDMSAHPYLQYPLSAPAFSPQRVYVLNMRCGWKEKGQLSRHTQHGSCSQGFGKHHGKVSHLYPQFKESSLSIIQTLQTIRELHNHIVCYVRGCITSCKQLFYSRMLWKQPVMSETYKRQSSLRTSIISIQLTLSWEALMGKVLWALISCLYIMT